MAEKQKQKRGPALNTAGRVTAEMARIYRLSKLKLIEPEEYKLWNDGLAKMREGMMDHEIERRMEELHAKMQKLGTNVVNFPGKRA